MHCYCRPWLCTYLGVDSFVERRYYVIFGDVHGHLGLRTARLDRAPRDSRCLHMQKQSTPHASTVDKIKDSNKNKTLKTNGSKRFQHSNHTHTHKPHAHARRLHPQFDSSNFSMWVTLLHFPVKFVSVASTGRTPEWNTCPSYALTGTTYFDTPPTKTNTI